MILPTIKMVCETPPSNAKQTITVSLEYADDPRRSLHMSVTDMQHATDAMEFLTQAIRDIRALNDVPQTGACCDSGYLGGNFLDGAACGDRQNFFEAAKHLVDPMTGKQYTGTIDMRASVKRSFPSEQAQDAWSFGVPEGAAWIETPDYVAPLEPAVYPDLSQEHVDAINRATAKFVCETCNGEGKLDANNTPCPSCGGTGFKPGLGMPETPSSAV